MKDALIEAIDLHLKDAPKTVGGRRPAGRRTTTRVDELKLVRA